MGENLGNKVFCFLCLYFNSKEVRIIKVDCFKCYGLSLVVFMLNIYFRFKVKGWVNNVDFLFVEYRECSVSIKVGLFGIVISDNIFRISFGSYDYKREAILFF